MNAFCDLPPPSTPTRRDNAGSATSLDARSYLERIGMGVVRRTETPAVARLPLPTEAQARLEPECLVAWRTNLAMIRIASAQRQTAGPATNTAAVGRTQQTEAASPSA